MGFRSAFDRLPQRRTGAVKETLHPLAAAAGVMIFANGSAWFWRWRNGPCTALSDAHVRALIARFQLTIEPEFNAYSLASHSRTHLRAQDLITASGERQRVVVADHTFLDVTKNRSQIQLLGQCPMMIGKLRHRTREMFVPLRPVLRLQKLVGV